jgi:hypothetical protein
MGKMAAESAKSGKQLGGGEFGGRSSTTGHERGASPLIIIFDIGNSALPSWKPGCSPM